MKNNNASELPIGTDDYSAFEENVSNIDRYANDRANEKTKNRKGEDAYTMYGLEQRVGRLVDGAGSAFDAFIQESRDDYQNFLDSSGFSGWDIQYAEGIVLNSHSQGFTRCEPDGASCLFYTPRGDTPLPYTTTGDWGSESSLFVVQNGDVALRQDLASPIGDTLISTGTRTQFQKNSDTLNPIDFLSIRDAIEQADQNNSAVTVYKDSIIRIPTDCESLQKAADILTPANKNIRVVLLIESGHKPVSGMYVQDGDYSWLTVQGEESHITLSDDFSGRFIDSVNATAPVLGAYVISTSRRVDRFYSVQGGFGYVKPACGGDGAYGRPLYCNAGLIQAPNTIWKRGADSIYASAGAGIQLGGADIEGFTVTSNGSVTSSRGAAIEAQGIKLRDSARGFEVKRAGSSINAHGAIVDNISGFVARTSRLGEISLTTANITNCRSGAIECYGGSVNLGEGSIITGSSTAPSSHAIIVNGGGRVEATGIVIDGFSGRGIWAYDASTVAAENSNIKNCGSHGIFSERLAKVNARGSTVQNSGGNDLRVQEGGEINAFQSKTTNSTGNSPIISDTNIQGFGQFSAIAQGGRGIIWA